MATITYNVTALQMTIYFNKEGDHDHNGLLFVLNENLPILKYIRAQANGESPTPSADVINRATLLRVPLPSAKKQAQMPHPLVRPLVLRCNKGDAFR